PGSEKKENKRNALGQEFLIPALAVITGLIVGAIVIFVSGENPLVAYGALFAGSFGSPAEYIEGFKVLFATGDNTVLIKAIYPFTESLVTATP
ncbi:hypothetical protein LW953_17550, partial [Erwinia amylovora]